MRKNFLEKIKKSENNNKVEKRQKNSEKVEYDEKIVENSKKVEKSINYREINKSWKSGHVVRKLRKVQKPKNREKSKNSVSGNVQISRSHLSDRLQIAFYIYFYNLTLIWSSHVTHFCSDTS